jgi:anti-sigma regulatory factor (Ser/Thr protein kinase)
MPDDAFLTEPDVGAARAGLSEDRASDVVLAVHELAAHAVSHGAGHGRLRMWKLPASLTCEVVDGGSPGPAAADKAEPSASASPQPPP